jgi:spore coat protein U-like protein
MLRRLRFNVRAARPVFVLALLLIASKSQVAQAGTATSNTAVTATVVANCTISTTPVAFGNYDPVAANATTPLQSSGSVTIACTKGSAPTIGISLGANALGSVRRMTDGAFNFLDYEIYQPASNAPGAACAFTTVWGTAGAGLFTPTSPTSKAARTYNVCGQIPAAQDIAAGSFADTVVATVNF